MPEDNPYEIMYDGLLKQWNALAVELQETKISISGDDKTFDRFAKFLEKLGPMTDSLEKLRKKIGLEDAGIKHGTGKTNPVEQRAK
jgi:hypothetical protein